MSNRADAAGEWGAGELGALAERALRSEDLEAARRLGELLAPHLSRVALRLGAGEVEARLGRAAGRKRAPVALRAACEVLDTALISAGRLLAVAPGQGELAGLFLRQLVRALVLLFAPERPAGTAVSAVIPDILLSEIPSTCDGAGLLRPLLEWRATAAELLTACDAVFTHARECRPCAAALVEDGLIVRLLGADSAPTEAGSSEDHRDFWGRWMPAVAAAKAWTYAAEPEPPASSISSRGVFRSSTAPVARAQGKPPLAGSVLGRTIRSECGRVGMALGVTRREIGAYLDSSELSLLASGWALRLNGTTVPGCESLQCELEGEGGYVALPAGEHPWIGDWDRAELYSEAAGVRLKLERFLKSPPRSLRRWTDARFPESLPLGACHELELRLLLTERLGPDGTPMPVPAPRAGAIVLEPLEPQAPAGQPAKPVLVDVLVSSPGFRVKPSFQRLEIPRDGDSPPVVFELEATRAGTWEILLQFLQDGNPRGCMRLACRVAAIGEPVCAGPARVRGEASFRASSAAGQSPDLLLIVSPCPMDSGHAGYQFTLHSPHDWGIHYETGLCSLEHRDPGAYVDRLLQPLRDLAHQEPQPHHRLEFEAVGAKLWRLFPAKLAEHLLRVRDQADTLVIISDDPWVPWELMRPSRLLDGRSVPEPFLCERYAVVRQLRGCAPAGVLRVSSAKVVAHSGLAGAAGDQPVRDVVVQARPQAAASGRPESPDALPSIEAEVRELKQTFHPVPVQTVPPLLDPVCDLLRTGGFDVLHVACHGLYDHQCPDLNSLRLEDGHLREIHIQGELTNFGKSRPLVFLNACHTGRLGLALDGPASLAVRFMEAGSGAVVGTLWAVHDDVARLFATTFYEHLLGDATLGEAARRARLACRDKLGDNPTWLAYVVYGDPRARRPAAPGSGSGG